MVSQNFTDHFNQHADTLRQAAAAQDHDDLQHAISGAAKSAVLKATQSAEDTLASALAKLKEAQDSIVDALTNAAKLPDGTAVFRTKDGVVKDAGGNVIAADIAAGVQWRGDEPSYEEYHALVNRSEDLELAANELRSIEIELGGLQGQLDVQDAPPSIDGLEVIQDQADALAERIDEIAGKTLSAAPTSLEHSDHATPLSVEASLVSLSHKPEF